MEQSTHMQNNTITIAGVDVGPGQQATIDLPLAAMATHKNVEMTIHVINGKKPGPNLFISAAIHGDELNGVEIIRRLVKQKQMQQICGSLIAIPIVNVHGFITHSRYLPDGRDLNRSFPGSSTGSLASRMAYTFLTEIVSKSTHGIDLHTGARHRENLPQIRADLGNAELKKLCLAFGGVSVIIDSKIRDGSLRQAGDDSKTPILLYEAGEALRFDESAIRIGVKGIQNVMRALGMLPESKNTGKKNTGTPVTLISNTAWVRAPYSGILRVFVRLGARCEKGCVLGVIADPLGKNEYQVIAPETGIVIGRSKLPLVYEGDALFHLAY